MNNLQYFKENRHATWLELFFDLVFVASIGVITHHIIHTHHGHVELKQLLLFVIEFIPVWWIWATHTLYCNRFDSDNAGDRLASLFIMLLMVSMAIFLGESMTEMSASFIAFYVTIRVVLAGMYMTSVRKIEGASGCARKMSMLILGGAGVAALSLLVPPPYGQILFLGAIFVEMLVAPHLGKNDESAPVHGEHLVERVGLLSIIILGESVISMVAGLREIELTEFSTLAAFTGFVLIGAIWWIYFDRIDILARAKRLGQGYILLYSQLLFAVGLGLLASVIRHAILNDIPMTDFRILAISGMVAFYLGKQSIYYSVFPIFRINIIINSFVCIAVTVASTFLPRLEHALIGMTCGLLFYVFSNYKWTLTKDVSEYLEAEEGV